jgi:hypothetical protein
MSFWSVESISRYPNNEKILSGAAKLLKPKGRMAITDWFKKDGLTLREHKKFLQPTEKGMLVELPTMEKYEALMRKNGSRVVRTEILNKHCPKRGTSAWISSKTNPFGVLPPRTA